MAVNIGQISNPSILIKPSKSLSNYLTNKLKKSTDLPTGINLFMSKKHSINNDHKKSESTKYFLGENDLNYLETLNLNSKIENVNISKDSSTDDSGKLLSLQDLYWLYEHLQKENLNKENKIHLHELFEGSEIVLPKNVEIPRNEDLEKRCQQLKAAQQNLDYSNMTKNVDNSRKMLPEDTISYQIKQINRHLLAIAQFIFSVLAGFAFGFVGVELLIGNLDFGFRLLLGIICALTIALAELYFLAKKLNEDLQFEEYANKKAKNTKID